MGLNLCSDLNANVNGSRFPPTGDLDESEENNIDGEPNSSNKNLPSTSTRTPRIETPHTSKDSTANFSRMSSDSTKDQEKPKKRVSFLTDQTVDSCGDNKPPSKFQNFRSRNEGVTSSQSGLEKLPKISQVIESPSSEASTKAQNFESKLEGQPSSAKTGLTNVGSGGIAHPTNSTNPRPLEFLQTESHGDVPVMFFGKSLPRTNSVEVQLRDLDTLPEMEQANLNEWQIVSMGDAKDSDNDSRMKLEHLSQIWLKNDVSSVDNGGLEMERSKPDLSERKSINLFEDSDGSEIQMQKPGLVIKKSVNLFDDSSEEERQQPSNDEVSEDKVLLIEIETADPKQQLEDNSPAIVICPKSEDEDKWPSPCTTQDDDVFLKVNDQKTKDDWLEDGDTRVRFFSESSVVSASSFSSQTRDRANTIPTCPIDSNLIDTRRRSKFKDFDRHVIPGSLETIKSVLLNEQQLSLLFESDPSTVDVTVAKWEKREGGHITTVKFSKEMNKKVFKIKIKNVEVTKVFRITSDSNKVRVWDTTSQSGVRYSEILLSHNIWTFRSKPESEQPECIMDIEFGLEFLKKPNIPGLKKTMKKEARKQAKTWNDLMTAEIAKCCQVLSEPNLFD